MNSVLSRHLAVILMLGLVCCLAGGCAGPRGMGTSAKVESNPPLSVLPMPAGSAVWVEVNDKSDLGDVGPGVRSLLIALLQSDKGLSLADSAASATGTVRVDILQMGLTNSEAVHFDMAQGFGMGLTGAVLGLGIGSGVGGRNGALWGAGLGLALGFGAGGAAGGGSEDTWALLADVQISSGKPAKVPTATASKSAKVSTASKASKGAAPLASAAPPTPTVSPAQSSGTGAEVLSRVAVTAQGRDMPRESALASLEDALAQYIVGHIVGQSENP